MLVGDITKINRSLQNSFFTALIVIAALGMYRWLVTPHVKCLYAAQQYGSSINRLEDKNESIASEVRVESLKLKEVSDEFNRSRSNLFTPEQAKEFFGALQAVFEETGCTVNLFNLTQSKSSKRNKQSGESFGIVANSATLSFNGSYGNIVRLVETLQNQTPRVFVGSFKLEIVEFHSGQLRCDMVITIYIIQDKENAL